MFTTSLQDCFTSPADVNTDELAPCTHEEADTRLLLHVSAATHDGHRRIVIRTNDSDVVVLAVSAVAALAERIDELWLAFGTGRHFRYL